MANQQTLTPNRSDQKEKNQSNAPRKLDPGQSDELIQQEQGNTPKINPTQHEKPKTHKQKDSGGCGCG